MKKTCIAFALVAILTFSLVVPAGATVSTPNKLNLDSGVSISTEINGYLTTRKADRTEYLKINSPSSDNIDYDAIRKELAALGISQQTINDMEDWYLLEYAQSPSIVYSSGYYKIDTTGTATPISEQAALQGAALALQNRSVKTTAGQRNTTVSDDNDFLYLELVITFFPGQNGLFSHRTASTWIIPPTNMRGNDYIGSSAKNSAVIDATRAGWAKYNKNLHNTTGDIVSTSEETYTFLTNNFRNAEDGTYSGSAGYFPLPKDQYHQGGTPTKTYTNIRAAYYYQAELDFYESPQNVKMTASYLHQVYGLTFTPNLVIDSGKNFGSIGVSVSTGYSREVNLSTNINYTP